MTNKLLIGNPNSTFIQEMILELKKNNHMLRVDLICSKRHLQGDIHADNKYNIIPDYKSSLFKLFGFYFNFMVWFIGRNDKVRYDSIDIHFANLFLLPILPLLKKNCKSLNLVFWGSDLFRCNNKFLLNFMIYMCDVINISTINMREYLKKTHRKALRNKKIELNRFGSNIFREIDEIDIRDVNEYNCYFYNMLKSYGDRTTVVIGYNASKAQQHIKILQSIKHVKNIDELTFIFPLTYGLANCDYIEEIKNLCSELRLNAIYLTEYMTELEVTYLRKVTDVLIQLQITDAFSSSMQQHLYAGARVITGSWLEYEELVQKSACFNQISKFDELPNYLGLDVLTLDEREKNKKIIAELSSWDLVIQGWESLGR